MARSPKLPKSPPVRDSDANYPEYGVRAETICGYFHPTMASSTFHDFVSKGKIIPLKGCRGYYKLNESLVRLGLKPVEKLSQPPAKTRVDDVIRLAFHAMDAELFPAPCWLLHEEVLGSADCALARMIYEKHAGAVSELGHDRLKINYLQGVLDEFAIEAADRIQRTD